ncbi:MAG: Holliday junction branch migration protein RuvA [bacterium]|jgi:Holliday junction DNA helicase RuvA|nr:Holliday junction branch migration protein RuvA [bacterium]MDD3804980.1 Holliday junction branch migration protein RuvA [bacterium]MDD4152902.1 Holliday junction branch migration protein RuvA [bacterium]MDD4558771.1 Holliday junction branch migration protein RuvA [bacterium]
MIAYLAGELLEVRENYVIIMAGGVGYRVELHSSAISKLPAEGEEVCLHIHTCVRADAITLVGFLTAEAREFFELLLGVSGVGLKVAQALISSNTLGRLKVAIATGEVATLVKAQGVGRKTAERIVVDLKDKIKDDLLIDEGQASVGIGDTVAEAITVLVELGYSRQRAIEAVRRVDAAERENGVEAVIREALKFLGH